MKDFSMMKKLMTYSVILNCSIYFYGCQPGSLMQTTQLTSEISSQNDNSQEVPGEDTSETVGYQYKGHCSSKFTVVKSSSLAPELKNGDKTCLEYSPEAYQNPDATGATIIIVSAVWCGPCKELKKQYNDIIAIASKYGATIKIFLDGKGPDRTSPITAETVNNYAPAIMFTSTDIRGLEAKVGRIESFPTVIGLAKNGDFEEIDRSPVSIEEFLKDQKN